MAQTKITGKIVSVKMKNSVVVEVTRKTAHPLYRKLIKTSKNFVAALGGHEVVEGDTVIIGETRKMAGNKHFIVLKKVK